ncbi:hypothetical protein [Azospirillum melinis]|uniref:hypothetical protein n=1 Tax=Azospirillum melinis TaxID=328839 RepID=UPI00157AC338|nr:hypothetical protein [Azospirillum melinis]MBP2309482.1 hypothetical protein [Azospirillum melinis]
MSTKTLPDKAEASAAVPEKPAVVSSWPRPAKNRVIDPFNPPLPRYSGPQTIAHEEMPADARAFMDRQLSFLGIDPESFRRRWLDSARHGSAIRISWVPERSFVEPAQTFRHTWVRYALDGIVLRPGAELTLETPFGDPVELYVHRLTLMEGARLTVQGGAARLVVGQLVGARPETADSVEPATLLLTSADGRDGDPGASGGHAGEPGLNGMPLRDMAVTVHTVTGRSRLLVRPGRGGNGGGGGNGGPGTYGHAVALYRMGRGGDGGHGGEGGDGGAGGDAGLLRLDVHVRQPGSAFELDVADGAPGAGGMGGAGGAGGIGLPDGLTGHAGRDGAPGRPGRPALVQWLRTGE